MKAPDQPVHLCSLIRFMQSDQGLHCMLAESLDTAECMNREQRPRWYIAQDDMKLLILCMLKSTFSFDVAHFIELLLSFSFSVYMENRARLS